MRKGDSSDGNSGVTKPLIQAASNSNLQTSGGDRLRVGLLGLDCCHILFGSDLCANHSSKYVVQEAFRFSQRRYWRKWCYSSSHIYPSTERYSLSSKSVVLQIDNKSQQGSPVQRVDMWEITHVPAKLPFPPDNQPTVNVFSSAIEPKFANSIVRQLNQIAPLENLRHVKRVRKERLEGGNVQLYVILCLALDGEEPLKCMPNAILKLMSSYQLSASITKVCGFPASSKEEWEEQCKLWPTSYHPPTYNIDGITGFSEEDAQHVCNFMSYAIQLAKPRITQVSNAAVIVDPSVKQVIASANDEVFYWHNQSEKTNLHDSCREQKSHHHIDLKGAATLTALNSNGMLNELKLYDGGSCLHPWHWMLQSPYSDSYYMNPLRHAAIAAIDYSAAQDRQLYPGPAQYTDDFIGMDRVLSSLADSPLKRQKTAKDKDDTDSEHTSKLARPYLCTGYDIYLVWEPCVMCAMALVHQRIRRIFFALPNPHAGALGSVHRLQGEKSLNHHYAVFRVMVPEENLANVEKTESAPVINGE